MPGVFASTLLSGVPSDDRQRGSSVLVMLVPKERGVDCVAINELTVAFSSFSRTATLCGVYTVLVGNASCNARCSRKHSSHLLIVCLFFSSSLNFFQLFIENVVRYSCLFRWSGFHLFVKQSSTLLLCSSNSDGLAP